MGSYGFQGKGVLGPGYSGLLGLRVFESRVLAQVLSFGFVEGFRVWGFRV